MSAIAEARGWEKTAADYRRRAKDEADPEKRTLLENRAEYWDDAAEEAWRDAKYEADEDAAYDRDHEDDNDDMGVWEDR